MPAGVKPAWGVGSCALLSLVLLPYGFQNLPPMTSTISMLYDWKRSLTVPVAGIFAGSSDTTWAISCIARTTTEVMHKNTAMQMHRRILLLISLFFFPIPEVAAVTNAGCAIFLHRLLHFLGLHIVMLRYRT